MQNDKNVTYIVFISSIQISTHPQHTQKLMCFGNAIQYLEEGLTKYIFLLNE